VQWRSPPKNTAEAVGILQLTASSSELFVLKAFVSKFLIFGYRLASDDVGLTSIDMTDHKK
jgi:hypothetical protein